MFGSCVVVFAAVETSRNCSRCDHQETDRHEAVHEPLARPATQRDRLWLPASLFKGPLLLMLLLAGAAVLLSYA